MNRKTAKGGIWRGREGFEDESESLKTIARAGGNPTLENLRWISQDFDPYLSVALRNLGPLSSIFKDLLKMSLAFAFDPLFC